MRAFLVIESNVFINLLSHFSLGAVSTAIKLLFLEHEKDSITALSCGVPALENDCVIFNFLSNCRNAYNIWVPSPNRIENLRECTRREQVLNRKVLPNKDTGVVGIYVDRTNGLKKKYAFSHNGKTYRFYSVEEARKAKENVKEIM